MKIISLNTWGGRAGLPLLQNFFKKNNDVDIFCLQEIWQTSDESVIENRDPRIVGQLLQEIAACLPKFNFYFRPQYRGIYGLATFIRKTIPVNSEGEVFVFGEKNYENPTSMGNHGRNIQHVTISASQGPVTIINFHGLWNGAGKSDSADRILQSQKIIDFISTVQNQCVLLGDFNLTPDTESFKILLASCPVDLIFDNKIKSTRSSFYPKPEKLADYVLTSKNIKTISFTVLNDEVSDHLALFADLAV